MTEQEKRILDEINEYAEEKLGDIDPQKVRISVQLETLKPIMEEIAVREKMSVEDVFILYMDLASTSAVTRQKKFEEDFIDLDLQSGKPFNS